MTRASGFSLIEIIVAVGLFSVVAILTVGSLFILTSAEKRVASIQANQDNVRFALFDMIREIRNGYPYSVACGGGGVPADCFETTNLRGQVIRYRISANTGECGVSAVGNCVLRSIDGLAAHPITGPDVKIDRLSFYLAGESNLDDIQPHVTVVLQGIAQEGTQNETHINLQSTISMLQFDG